MKLLKLIIDFILLMLISFTKTRLILLPLFFLLFEIFKSKKLYISYITIEK